MKRPFFSIWALTLILPALLLAQARPDFSGRWTLNAGKSTRGVSGNSPAVSFPSEMVVKHTPIELHVQSNTVRQDSVIAVYKLDGSEIAVGAPAGITEKAKAAWVGGALVITSRRSYSSPIGDVVTDFKESWTLAENVLTIEKTRSSEGASDTEKAVFDKTQP
jgi:hypothetical protein